MNRMLLILPDEGVALVKHILNIPRLVVKPVMKILYSLTEVCNITLN